MRVTFDEKFADFADECPWKLEQRLMRDGWYDCSCRCDTGTAICHNKKCQICYRPAQPLKPFVFDKEITSRAVTNLAACRKILADRNSPISFYDRKRIIIASINKYAIKYPAEFFEELFYTNVNLAYQLDAPPPVPAEDLVFYFPHMFFYCTELTQEICDFVFEHNKWFIQHIPAKFRTLEMLRTFISNPVYNSDIIHRNRRIGTSNTTIVIKTFTEAERDSIAELLFENNYHRFGVQFTVRTPKQLYEALKYTNTRLGLLDHTDKKLWTNDVVAKAMSSYYYRIVTWREEFAEYQSVKMCSTLLEAGREWNGVTIELQKNTDANPFECFSSEIMIECAQPRYPYGSNRPTDYFEACKKLIATDEGVLYDIAAHLPKIITYGPFTTPQLRACCSLNAECREYLTESELEAIDAAAIGSRTKRALTLTSHCGRVSNDPPAL